MAWEYTLWIVIIIGIALYFITKPNKEEGYGLLGNANKFHKEHSRCMRDCSLSDKRKGSVYHKWACSKYCDIVLDEAVAGKAQPHTEPTPHELCSTIYSTNNQIANCECMEEVKGWCSQECRYSDELDCEDRCLATKKVNCKSGNNWVRMEE